jgi:putative tryptophan/tyrosine transport system substrate-binding protein
MQPLKRREFITLLGGAAARPLAARAQQAAMPVIGYVSSGSPESDAPRLGAFRQGLNELDYVEGRNVAIEYRGMQGHYDLLPEFIADFVRRPVAVISVSGNTPAVQAAKMATSTIPIVFNVGTDPVQSGLVASLNRPGGNVTGISNLTGPLAAKRLELLHELVPGASVIALLANPSNPAFTEYEMGELRNAAMALGLQLHILNASAAGEIDSAFATLPQVRAGALLTSAESFFISRVEQIAALAARHAVPAMGGTADFPAAGGLMSYAPTVTEPHRQMGIYVGRILKGEKPGDLPVQQSTKVELIINLKTAKALGITFPLTLLGRADEVIE